MHTCQKNNPITQHSLLHLTCKNEPERDGVNLTLFHFLAATLVLQWPLAWQTRVPLHSAWRNNRNGAATPDHSSCNTPVSTVNRMHVRFNFYCGFLNSLLINSVLFTSSGKMMK